MSRDEVREVSRVRNLNVKETSENVEKNMADPVPLRGGENLPKKDTRPRSHKRYFSLVKLLLVVVVLPLQYYYFITDTTMLLLLCYCYYIATNTITGSTIILLLSHDYYTGTNTASNSAIIFCTIAILLLLLN